MAAAPTPSISRKRINRAGKLLREVRAALDAGDDDRLDAIDPKRLREAIEIVEWWRSLHARPLRQVNAGLRHYIRKAGCEPPEVTQRLKRFSTIVHKLNREPTMALSTMEDIGGVRAILPTQDQVLDVVSMLERAKRWTISRRRFYIEGGRPGPKADGYRAVHLIVEKSGCNVEIQLRTPVQDIWAQSVEQDTRRLRTDLKFGAGPDDLREYYRLVSEWMAMREQHVQPPKGFMEDLAKLYRVTRRYFPSPPGTT